MGIYIQGIKMPEDGCHHIICIYADGTVATGSRDYRAIPIPEDGTGVLSHEIVVKGNCTACGKTLRENDGLFLCAECQKKNNEQMIIEAEEG